MYFPTASTILAPSTARFCPTRAIFPSWISKSAWYVSVAEISVPFLMRIVPISFPQLPFPGPIKSSIQIRKKLYRRPLSLIQLLITFYEYLPLTEIRIRLIFSGMIAIEKFSRGSRGGTWRSWDAKQRREHFHWELIEVIQLRLVSRDMTSTIP